MGTTNLGSNGTSAAVCGNNFVVGTGSGAIYVVESKTGLCTITLSRAIHTGTVHSIDVDHSGEWLVSTSADGTVKVWTLKGSVITSLQNTRKVVCACFLNDKHDIVIAARTQLEVVASEHYASEIHPWYDLWSIDHWSIRSSDVNTMRDSESPAGTKKHRKAIAAKIENRRTLIPSTNLKMQSLIA